MADVPIVPGTARYARTVSFFQHVGARLLPGPEGRGFRREEFAEPGQLGAASSPARPLR